MNKNRLDEHEHYLRSGIEKLGDDLDRLMKYISEDRKEEDRSRTVLEALRKDPYEFYACASWRGTRQHPEMRVTSFALYADADTWQTEEYRNGALMTACEKQTMPQHPDLDETKRRLDAALYLLRDWLNYKTMQYSEMERLKGATKEMVDGD